MITYTSLIVGPYNESKTQESINVLHEILEKFDTKALTYSAVNNNLGKDIVEMHLVRFSNMEFGNNTLDKLSDKFGG